MSNTNMAQIEKYLKTVDYPAKKADLIKSAEQQGADKQTRDILAQLPDQTFEKMSDVSKAVSAVERGAR